MAPAVISRAMIVPSRSLKRASDISGMRDPIRKGMLPGINAPGSPVACCRSSPVFKPCRALACRASGLSRGSHTDACQSITRGPMDALYRQYPFCFLLFRPWGGGESNLEIVQMIKSSYPWSHDLLINPLPANHRGSGVKNSPS
jgi:hypothetical protein